jgi:predicted nucleotidyltransferase
MDMETAREQYLSVLRRFAAEHGAEYGITRIGIFGSVARDEQTSESDLDVLVEAPVLGLFSLAGIKRQLEDIFGIPVDVVRKTDYMPPRFKTRIEKEVIYV